MLEMVLWFSRPRWNIFHFQQNKKVWFQNVHASFLFPPKQLKELFEKIYFSRSTPTQSPLLIITSLCKLGKDKDKEKIKIKMKEGWRKDKDQRPLSLPS